MKKEDLMIGDWVLMDLNYDSDYEFDNVNYQPYQIKTGEDIDMAIETNMMATDAIYRGIQINHELLEKNGFKEDFETNGIYWRPDFRKFCIVKELDTWYFAFRVLGETVDKSSGYICISECNYVHKLQHILKDLEIEKEIVL